MQLWRGRSNRCASNPWGSIIAGSCSGSINCVDEVDMATYSTRSRRVLLRMSGSSSAAICIEPDGDTLVASPASSTLFSTTVPGGRQAPWFSVRTYLSGVRRGVVRYVVFPMGGMARVR